MRFLQAGFLLSALLLSSCGSDEKQRPTVSPAQASVPQGMSYQDYRNHADEKARKAGGEEESQRDAERRDGNIALHKRFMALDRNNDGRLSHMETGGL